MHEDKIDKLLRSSLSKDSVKIENLSDISVPDMDEAINRMLEKVNQNVIPISADNGVKSSRIRKQKYNRKRYAVFAFLLIFLLVLVSSYRIPQVVAFRDSLIKTFKKTDNDTTKIKTVPRDEKQKPIEGTNAALAEEFSSLNQAQEKLPFHLCIPGYMPEGYKLLVVKVYKYPNNRYTVEQYYNNDNGKTIQIKQLENRQQDEKRETNIKNIAGQAEIVEINGYNVNIIASDTIVIAEWFTQNSKFTIYSYLPKDEIIKFINEYK